jgi:hypothetical protein
MMRVAFSIIVIIGALLTAALGIIWISDYNDNKELIASVQQTSDELGLDNSELEDLKGLVTAAYVMLACAVVAFITVFLRNKLGKITGIILLAAGILPAVFETDSLMFTFFIILGGILSFFIKPKVKTA